MACRYTYQGKTYEAHEFDDVLRAMPLAEASKFMPGVRDVPSAPFVGKTDAWVALALKRVVKMAVDEGYDKVAFVTGEQSAERYDLSKQLDTVLYDRREGGGGEVIGRRAGHNAMTKAIRSDDGLADVIGKDLARKLLDAPTNPYGMHSLSGIDLKVGGEGMKAFYDRIVPAVLKDVLRRVGGSPTTVDIARDGIGNVWYDGKIVERGITRQQFDRDWGDGYEFRLKRGPKGEPETLAQPGFDVTDAMRERAAGGLPLFSEKRIFDDSGRQYTEEQRKAFERVGFVVEVPTLRERLQSLRQHAGKKIAQGLFDQFVPIKDLSKRAYALARLSRGSSGAFEALLHHGKLKVDETGVYDADTTGGAIERVFIPLGKETGDFLKWIAANRAERLMGEGRERLFSDDDIAAIKSLEQGTTDFDYQLPDGRTTRDRTLIYRDSLKKFDEFNRNVLDVAEQSGLIDREARAIWEHEFYVPFYRVSGDGEFNGASVKNGLVRQEAIKALKGGTDKLNADMLSNTLLNWAHLVDASAKNRAAIATLEAAEEMGAAVEAPAGTAKDMAKAAGAHEVWVMDEGVKRHFVVADPHLMVALSSLQFAGLRGGAMDALSKTKHWLTVVVTASPFFKIRNLIRDSVSAIATSDLSGNVAGNLALGLKASERGTQEYVSALAGGGLIRFGTMLEGRESDRVRRLVEMGNDRSTILDSPSKVRTLWNLVEKGISAYNELGNRGEEINRSALYHQLIEQGVPKDEAALQARDLLDFSMQGSWYAVRFLTQVVPFMNARLQGLYKLGRAAKENPAKFGAVVGAVLGASLVLMAAYSDDEDWKKREDWDRNNYWWFKFGGKAYRIPKPFEVGAIATLAERGAELFFNEDMTGERYYKIVKDLFLNSLSMNPVPQAFKPIVDLYSNKDSFTGRPIETMGMQKLDPEYRYTSRTTMPARAVSTVTGGALSPVQVDHLVKAYFGWLGALSVGAVDQAVRPLTSEPTRPQPDYWKVATGGLASETDSASSYYVTRLYEQAKEMEAAYATWRSLLKEGRVEEAKEYLEENKEDIVRHKALQKVKEGEAKFSEMIRMIERSTTMDAGQKKERINRIRAQQDRLARTVGP